MDKKKCPILCDDTCTERVYEFARVGWLARKSFAYFFFLLQMFILTGNINLFHTLSEVDFKIPLLFCDINNCELPDELVHNFRFDEPSH